MHLESLAKPVGEKRVVVRGLDWDGFKQIQQLLAERTRARFAYDARVLEITQSLESHERLARLIELFIRILVVELGLKMKTMGSTTLDREDLLKSAEPDNG
ncbi:MAG: Uma2 family endonuclease, partial [Cyanobacteria bacterium P01_H01_bin.105]